MTTLYTKEWSFYTAPMNIKDLMQLAGKQGKVIVVNELGDVQGVFMSFNAYQKLSGSIPITEVKEQPKPDPEKINREILESQLAEEEILSATEDPAKIEKQAPLEKLDSLLSKRAEQLFKSIPYNYTGRPDLRSEVIDPNYDFNAPESNDDEVIKPSFDDI